MAATLEHRGPDDKGARYFPEHMVGLGFRRLSIIDLSPSANQPMSNDCGNIWMVFNGEIYNYRELRKELEGQFKFKSNSDSETILRLYEQEGLSFVQRLNGMFSIAIYDARPPAPTHPNSPNLVLARDPLGIKPLYYSRVGGRFLFASEIKAILASGLYQPDIDFQAAWDYFTYLYVPNPRTMFKHVLQVPPATLAQIDLKAREVVLDRYWSPLRRMPGKNAAIPTYQESKSQLRKLLIDSVERQMVSDVPVGVFLSGGIDSAIVTGLMAQSSSRAIKSFTVIFKGRGLEFFNEQTAARSVAEKFGTDHNEIEVDLSDPWAMFDLVEYFDQPFGNPTSYVMYLISQQARSKVTVALCGAGGDELFGGYPRYKAARLATWTGPLSPLAPAVRWLASLPSDDYTSMKLRRLRKLLEGLDGDLASKLVRWTYFMSESKKRLVLNPSFLSSEKHVLKESESIARSYLRSYGQVEHANAAMLLDLDMFLPDNVLEYTDKMSMATSLEVRVPLLDHRVVELAAPMPFSWKVKGRDTKAILKDACSDLLPQGHATAAKKGFNVPLGQWVRDELDSYFESVLTEAEVKKQGIFLWGGIQRLRYEHRRGSRDNAHELYSIIMFDVWYRKYILQSEPMRRVGHESRV